MSDQPFLENIGANTVTGNANSTILNENIGANAVTENVNSSILKTKRRVVMKIVALLFFTVSLNVFGVLAVIGNGLESELDKAEEISLVIGGVKQQMPIKASNISFQSLRMAELEERDIRLKSPFTSILAGPSSSGKTFAIKEIIARRKTICTDPPDEIIYCYGMWQNIYDSFSNEVTFSKGMIDVENEIPSDGKPRWLVIDDLMDEIAGKNETDKLFTKYSHHKNISVFFIVQNIFRKDLRTVNLNAHYFFLFKNPRDASQVNYLARQMYPKQQKFLVESYEDATSEAYSSLLIDVTQSSPKDIRVLGNYIYGPTSGNPVVAYVPI